MTTTTVGDTPVPAPSLDPAAVELAQRMLERKDVMRTIIEETLESGRRGRLSESGRTVCGTARRPLPPILRRFAQVTLPTCPVTVGGTWHTHITREQLLRPENSLPDWANVAFGVIDVSVVVGAQTSEIVVGARDRLVMQRELRHVLGVDAQSVEDVVAAIVDGDVRNPAVARSRLRQQLRPLVSTVETPFPDLAEEIRTTEVLATPKDVDPGDRRFEMIAACPMYDVSVQRFIGGGSFDRFRGLARANAGDITRAAGKLLPPEDVDIRSQAWATGIGFFVSQMLSDLLTQ